MDIQRKHELLAQAKSNRVSNIPIVESETEPNTTHCIWLKQGIMYAFENGVWEALNGEGGSGSGGGVIKLPVKFDTIEVTGGGDDPQKPIVNSVNPTTGNTKANPPLYYCKQKVSGDLFGPTENGIVLDLAFYFGGGGNPKGGNTRAIKSGLDDISHQYFSFQEGSLIEQMKGSQMMLKSLGLDDDSSAKVLASWVTRDSDDQVGLTVFSLIYKGSNYLYIADRNNIGLWQFYNNPNFKGITIMEAEEAPGPEPIETA